MLRTYLPAIVFLILGSVIGSLFAVLNLYLGPRHPNRNKQSPYECGLPSEIQRGFRFGISFYLVAMLFILFDIEAIFLYPWVVVYRELKMVGFVEMLVFVILILSGFFYIWKKGALDWSGADPDRRKH